MFTFSKFEKLSQIIDYLSYVFLDGVRKIIWKQAYDTFAYNTHILLMYVHYCN